MSEKIGRAAHYCVRDELPEFMDREWTKYSDGDYVRCSCGRVWYVLNGTFCHYREIKGRKLRRLIESGVIEVSTEGETTEEETK